MTYIKAEWLKINAISQFPVPGTAEGGCSNGKFEKPYPGEVKEVEILRITQKGAMPKVFKWTYRGINILNRNI